MLVVGLTGGIGSGKTAVSEGFARHGVPVIDTDLIARELVEPGQPALAEIVNHFGPDCLDGEGRLHRARLRERVFADPTGRRQLEAILHPRIRALVRERVAALAVPYCLVVIPLLAPVNGKSSGAVAAAPALLAAIVANPAGYYVNVHNAEYPGGAVRGQLQLGD